MAEAVPIGGESPLQRIQREKREEREAGRAEGRAEWESHVQGAVASAIAPLREEHKRSLAEISKRALDEVRSAYAHGFHKAAWMFGIPAFIIGGILVGLGLTWAQTKVFDQAIDAASQRDMTDAIIDRVREPMQ